MIKDSSPQGLLKQCGSRAITNTVIPETKLKVATVFE